MVYAPGERQEEEEYDYEIRQSEADANRLRAEVRRLNIELGESHEKALGLIADYEPRLEQALAEIGWLRAAMGSTIRVLDAPIPLSATRIGTWRRNMRDELLAALEKKS